MGSSGHHLPVSSPPAGPEPSEPATPPAEVLGAGLPLLQRLRLLRERESRAAAAAEARAEPEPRQDSSADHRRGSAVRKCPPVLKLIQNRCRSDTAAIADERPPPSYVSIATQTVADTAATGSPSRRSDVVSDVGDVRDVPSVVATSGVGGSDSQRGSPLRQSPRGSAARDRDQRLARPDIARPSSALSSPSRCFSGDVSVFRYDSGSISDVVHSSDRSPGSPLTSETAQRRGLKSILRRLGGSMDTADPGSSPVAEVLSDPASVQGYLARKRNFMKAVSFNQRTPPGSVSGSRDVLPDVTSQVPQAPAASPCGDLLAEIRSVLHEKLVSG